MGRKETIKSIAAHSHIVAIESIAAADSRFLPRQILYENGKIMILAPIFSADYLFRQQYCSIFA